jgi:hypothetical protein
MRYLAAMLLLCLPAAAQTRPLPDVPGTWELIIEPASNTKWPACSEAGHRIFLRHTRGVAEFLKGGCT